MARNNDSADIVPLNTIIPHGGLSADDQYFYQALSIDINASPPQMGQPSSQINPPVSPPKISSDVDVDVEMELSMIQVKAHNIIESKKMLANNTLYKRDSLKKLSRFVREHIVSTEIPVNAISDLFKVVLEQIKERIKLDEKDVQSANGLGLQAQTRDYCEVTIQFPSDTVPKWKDPKSGNLEGLAYDFNLCEAVATWEQVRNSTTILTKEYINALPNGWEEYAWRRINKGDTLKKCENKTLCMEKLALVLPEMPPYVPRQFGRCAVVGNSGDLLKTNFGEEIDGYDAVIRENGAPIQNYMQYVGRKSTFRLLNRGSAKALDKVVELDETKKEALIIKTTIHDIMSKMIREVPIHNSVYLMLGTSSGVAAKGTGLKALEFSLSICDSVDMYGFTVDPGYKEWTRYFSESRQGHTPLQGRAYYQMMECLGLIKIHSPMRSDPNRIVDEVPSRSVINAARIASEKLLRWAGAGTGDPLGVCSIVSRRRKEKAPQRPGLRKPAVEHQKYVKGATMYPLEHRAGNGMLCILPAF